jgi:hypothetical protein
MSSVEHCCVSAVLREMERVRMCVRMQSMEGLVSTTPHETKGITGAEDMVGIRGGRRTATQPEVALPQRFWRTHCEFRGPADSGTFPTMQNTVSLCVGLAGALMDVY